MKNSKIRRALLLLACAVLLVSLSVGATLAYLTSSDAVKNTFTVGSVNITLDEAKVTEYGVVDGDSRVTANTYKLLPGHEYTKDPIVHVTVGSEPCYLFVKVVNEIANIEAEEVADDPTTTDVDETVKKIATQMTDNGWVALTGVDNVYYYNAQVDARTAAQNVSVFGTFTIAGGAAVAEYGDKTITVQAYAVQADGFDTAADAWTAAPCNWNEVAFD